MIDLETGTYNAGVPAADEHSWLLEYIGKCQRGEIIVGHELLQEFDILLDLFDNPDITFELADAKKRIKFIETKCRLYEAPYAGKPFTLLLWQKAFLESFYSFKIYDEELKRRRRLFSEFLLLCARKNGKSPFFAAIDLAEFFCGPMGVKILCSSNSYEETAAMFDGIEAMREESKSLEHLTRKNVHGIYFGNYKHPKHSGKFSFHNHGSIRRISAKTGSKDSRNIMVGAVDEVWELKDNTSTAPIKQSLSSQEEPIYGEISTEGTVNDGYLDDRLKKARKVLNGEDPTKSYWMIWLYTQDSEAEIWQQEQSWFKSNPSLGAVKKWRYLRDRISEAQTSKKDRVLTLCKDFNIKQNSATAWLTPQDYENPVTFADIAKKYGCNDIFEYLKGCMAIGGVDLSETTDLTCCKALIMHPGDTNKYILSRYFIPEAKLDDCPDDMDYMQCAKDDLLTICPGNDNDFSLITKWYVELHKKYGIRFYKIGYDNALAKFWVSEMQDIFDMERVAQKHEALSNPMTLLEQDLKGKLVVYNDNRLDKWCFGNTAMDMNKRGLIMPMKVQGQPKNRIDGTAALIDAYYVYQAYKPEFMKGVG
ncbi:MAG TPA: terminase TerL endonuclease subunit [Caproiciproducens sp.]|nr:terminase TerL endonuclease subunit [Caproiciproducens sp.]